MNYVDILSDLVKIPSTTGNEEKIVPYIKSLFEGIGCIVKVIRTTQRGKNINNIIINPQRNPSLIINTHMDVVPANGWEKAFEPKIRDGKIYGRGTCDAKGQIVLVYETIKLLRRIGPHCINKIEWHIVSGEEDGGFGTSFLLQKYSHHNNAVKAVIVLEPTNFALFPANRGALWFRIILHGKSTHMGEFSKGINAIDRAAKIIDSFADFRKYLLEISPSTELFGDPTEFININVGRVSGGEWPSIVADYATIDGGISFLPNLSAKGVLKLFENFIKTTNTNYKGSIEVIPLSLKNDGYETPKNSNICLALGDSVRIRNKKCIVTGWNASCDARLYAKKYKVPTVVFGPGSLMLAHSNHEHIKLSELSRGIEILSDGIINFFEINGLC